MGGRRMEAACCPLLAPLLCFSFPSFNAGFVSVEDAWKKRVRYANRAAPPCQPGVRVIDVFACRFPQVDVRSVLSQVRDAFMVTDSFHLSRPFTLKSRLPVKKALWTASLHRHSQLLLTQAPRNLLRSIHTLLNQPAAKEGPLRACVSSKTSCEASRAEND